MKCTKPSSVAQPALLGGSRYAVVPRSGGWRARARRVAKAILTDLMPLRRLIDPTSHCAETVCVACMAPHVSRITTAILQGRPISFVLPAFPGKSPNLAKVLGPLPDHGERLALSALHDMALRVRHHHAPGARIILCSDGRVFSDVVGMQEVDVSAYHAHLEKMIDEAQFDTLSVFTLDHVFPGGDFQDARSALLVNYGQMQAALRERVKRGGAGASDSEDRDVHRLYCGITRFLLEDALHPGQTRSKTSLQKDARERAYEVIRRSNAWSNLIARHFPEAVRLSIHPQTCGASKLGVRLLTQDSWLTPWHSVAVETAEGFVLMKRAEAEKRGAELVLDAKDQASHFRLMPPSVLRAGEKSA